MKSSIPYIRVILLPLVIYKICLEDDKFLKNFLISISIVLFILVIDSTFEFVLEKNLLGKMSTENGRISSLFNDEYILGTFILRIFFIASALIFYLIKDRTIKFYLLFGFIYFVSFMTIFFSGDRTPLLLFGIASFFILFYLSVKKRIKFYFIVILVLFFSTILISNQNIYDRYVTKTLNEFGSSMGINESVSFERIQIINHGDKKITFLPTHQSLWITSFRIIEEKHLFGLGNKSFKDLCKIYKISTHGCATHPHNTYVQLLVESGIIGFIIFFSIFLLLAKKVFKSTFSKNKDSGETYFLYLALFINLWPIAQTGSFFNNWNSIMYYMPVGFLLFFNSFSYKNKILKK